MQPYVIGLDIGTGSTKAVAVTTSGAVLAQAQVYYTSLQTAPQFSEQDPYVIWAAFIKAIKQTVAKLSHPPAGVSLSSCMHSLILVGDDHKPLTPVITWADRRSAALAAALRETALGRQLYENTGTPLHAMSPLCKLKWFQQEEPGLFKKVAKAISIKEFIWARLFGVYEIDASVASATGLYAITENDWFEPSLQYCGIKKSQLSTPVSTHFTRANLSETTAAEMQLAVDTPFCIGSSDGCLALIGSHALTAGTAAITIGTSGAIRLASSRPLAVFPEMIFNYRLDDTTFVSGGAINNGGNLVQWLVRQFLESSGEPSEQYESLFALAASAPPGCAGLICLPYLQGERAPLWDEGACGVFFGIRPHHSKAHFVRAALEGVCYALDGILKKLEIAAGPIDTLHVSGGLVQAPFWMQLLADVTGKKLKLWHTEDASAVGAALLGYKAFGFTKAYPDPVAAEKKVLEPGNACRIVYDQNMDFFHNIYTALKPVMHAIQA
ncbi:MAG TPA: gluconokinase [Chitinophagaceae bacterium]|nr:gluconokinase [Chitinophagaceae bacterium]